ncbi:hypothetical protein AAY473_024116 [Plecturocebus cupreus]
MTSEDRERFLTGQQAIPKHREWNRRPLLTCIPEGLRQIRKKTMNHAILFTITKGKEENPTAFLE